MPPTHAARPRPQRRGPSEDSDGRTCFVKGFDTSLDESSIRAELTERFGEFGDVVEVRLPVDFETQRVKGFGYVVFAEDTGAPVRPRPPLPVTVLALAVAGRGVTMPCDDE